MIGGIDAISVGNTGDEIHSYSWADIALIQKFLVWGSRGYDVKLLRLAGENGAPVSGLSRPTANIFIHWIEIGRAYGLGARNHHPHGVEFCVSPNECSGNSANIRYFERYQYKTAMLVNREAPPLCGLYFEPSPLLCEGDIKSFPGQIGLIGRYSSRRGNDDDAHNSRPQSNPVIPVAMLALGLALTVAGVWGLWARKTYGAAYAFRHIGYTLLGVAAVGAGTFLALLVFV